MSKEIEPIGIFKNINSGIFYALYLRVYERNETPYHVGYELDPLRKNGSYFKSETSIDSAMVVRSTLQEFESIATKKDTPNMSSITAVKPKTSIPSKSRTSGFFPDVEFGGNTVDISEIKVGQFFTTKDNTTMAARIRRDADRFGFTLMSKQVKTRTLPTRRWLRLN